VVTKYREKHTISVFRTTIMGSRSSSGIIRTSIWARRLRFDSRQGLRFLFLATESRLALWSTQSPISCVLRVLSLGVKWPKC